MSLEQTLLKEIEDSKMWYQRKLGDHLQKRSSKKIELINWILENMKDPDIYICALIESKLNEIILSINRTYSIIEADKLHCELRILDWIFFQVCSNEIKIRKFERSQY